jgi:hypothetical protein
MHSSVQLDASKRFRAAWTVIACAALASGAFAQSTGPYNQLIFNQVQYNDSAAKQSTPTRQISQPQTLQPVRSYAPVKQSTPYPTTGAALVQPDYLAPAKEAPPAATTKPANPANLTASQAMPPTIAPPAATGQAAPRKPVQVPPQATAKKTAPKSKSQRSGFWQLVLGPEDTSTTTNTPTTPATPNRNQYAATTTTQPPAASGSLWNQFLGRNPAPAQPPAKPQPTTQARAAQPAPAAAKTAAHAANPLQLTAAETEGPNSWWNHPRPSARDVEQAKTPATSATITVSGSLPNPATPANNGTAAPSYASSPYPTTQHPATPYPTTQQLPAGVPPVPTVPGMTHSEMSGAAYGLLQPFQMTNDAPVAAMPDNENVRRTASKKSKQESPDANTARSLLEPFYATNDVPKSSRSRNSASSTSTANASGPTSVSDAVWSSSLGRQLTMQSDQDLRTSGLASIEAQKQSDQAWDGTVTMTWPGMGNPFEVPNATNEPGAPPPNVSHVAFMQDELPEPSANTRSPNELPEGEAKDDDSDADGDGKDKKDTLVGSETLGNAPEDNTLAFLRTQTVLLAPGKHQFDIGIEYTLTENDFPILITDGGGNVVRVDNVEIKARELAVPMELRYGLLPRVQGFLQVPVGWSNVQAAIDNYDEYENDGGIGDIGFGLTAQLRDAYKDCPYIIGTLAGLAPTGGDPFGVAGQITPSSPSLGNGFWAISGNLLWVQTRYDPVVLFYGLGARYQFGREYFNVDFQPGMEYNYTLGTGFAVNERVTLSTQFFGAFIEELKANGERVEGTIQEPLNLRIAATLAKPCNRLVEPFVTFGLTDDAISANVGITWTY